MLSICTTSFLLFVLLLPCSVRRLPKYMFLISCFNRTPVAVVRNRTEQLSTFYSLYQTPKRIVSNNCRKHWIEHVMLLNNWNDVFPTKRAYFLYNLQFFVLEKSRQSICYGKYMVSVLFLFGFDLSITCNNYQCRLCLFPIRYRSYQQIARTRLCSPHLSSNSGHCKYLKFLSHKTAHRLILRQLQVLS